MTVNVDGGLLHTALRLAEEAHRGQVDKQGLPYVLHVFRVVDRVKGTDAKIVAALHDVLEDSTMNRYDLQLSGFSADIVEAVEAITRDPRGPRETYAAYLDRVAANPLATEVKLADLRDNLDRLTPAIDPTGSLRNRYTRALAILRGDANVPRPD